MENQRFHAAAWKDQTVGALERMEDNIVAYVSDERIHGEQSTFFLNVDSENMETSNTEVDSFGTGGRDTDINPEEMFKEGAVMSVEAFEIPEISDVDDENNKRSRTVRSETCFDIDNLAETCTKELRSTLKIPDPDAFGKNETSHSMQSCLEVQCPEESVTLQGARLTLDAFKTEFHLNSEGTKMKELLTEMDFSGNLSNFWDQGTHSRLPIIPDLKEEKEQFSFHITACNEQIAGKKVGGTHASDCVSNEEQSEQSAFTLNVVNQNKVEAEDEVGVCGEGSSYSRSSYVREIKTEGTDFREKVIVTGEPSESPNQNCDNDKRGSRTILVKPCHVVLKELGNELEEKCEDSLINLDIETQSLKMQNERKADPLQVLSHGIPEKNYVKKQNKIIKIQNIKTLLENEKLNTIEKKEIKNPEKVITSRGSKNMDTKIHHNSEEPQAEGSLTQMDSTDLSDMIEEGIFSRLSLMEKEYKSSAINLFHEEEEDPGAKKLQTDFCSLSSMTPEVRKGKSREVTSVTMFRKNWNKLVKQLGREEISYSSLVVNLSGSTLQTEDLQGIPVEGTSTYLSVIKAENVFYEGKSRNKSPLLPAQSHSEDIHVTDCEPSCISTPVVEKLETSLKGELLCAMKNQLPRLENVVQCLLAESSQEVSEGQLNMEEQKSLNQRNFKSTSESDNNSCFLMEVAEDLENVDDVNITEGQKKAVQQEAGGKHLNPSEITLPSQSMEVPELWRPEAEWHSRSDNIKKIKHNDIKKTTALHCLEPPRDGHIRCIEKKVNPEPAKETYRAQAQKMMLKSDSLGLVSNEHLDLQVLLCPCIKKMAGPVVGLLGVPSKGCKPRRLQRLVELEDSSDDETCVCCQPPKKTSRSVLGVASSKAGVPHKMRRVEDLEDLSDAVYDDYQVTQEIKDSDYHPTLYKKEVKQLLKPYAAHVLWQKSLNSHCSNKKKRKDRRSALKEASASVPSLQMSEEQSRIKVIDSLRGMLLKRLEESPDLDVHEDTILRLANNVEKEIFNLFLCVDQRYRNKYRSLLFNLKAPKNKLLFHQVVLGEVSPQCLVQMNSLEMAPKELAEWRAKESKHVLEVIEKQQREPPRCCPTKLTHKGEIEIHNEVDEDFTLEDLYGSVLCIDQRPISKPTTESKRDTTDQHRSHLLDPDCLICTGRMAPDGERGFNPPRSKSSSKKKAEGSSRLHSTTVCSEKGRRHLEKGRPASTDNLKKNPELQRQAKDTVLWEGFIQMFSIKQFAAKAYPVSGYSTSLIQALPELIQSRGCILPEDVWDYLESIWPAEAKEMSVIQFCPTITKDFSTYNMLYSYLNNKQRYGIVDSNQMEIFMVPLPAFQPVPAKFHPLGGPGLDANHSCLLLGLILPKKVSDDHSANGTGLLRKTKRKTVTFKNTLVTKCISPPLDSSGSAQLAETFQQVPSRAFTGNWLSRDEYPPAVSHSQEPLTTNNVFALSMAMGEVLNGGPRHGASSSHCQNSKEEPNQSMQDCAFHSFSNFPWMGEQSYATAQESLGWQQNMMGGHTTFHADAGPAPSQYWNLGPLSSCSLCSHECSGNVALSASVLDIQQLSSMLCPGVTSSGEPSQVPSVPQLVSHEPSATSDLQSHAAAGDSNPEVPMEEALSLIQHLEALVQLNSQIQNQTLFSLPSLDLTAALQAAALGESQIVRGATFPPIQQESGVYPQSQLTLPPFCGPVYPSPGC